MSIKIPGAINFVIGNQELLQEMLACREHSEIFSRDSMNFLAAWAQNIRALPRPETTPALAAFAFWCRPNSLEGMKRQYEGKQYTGRGICLQYVPSNIPALFAYSLAAAILAGNSVVVRLSDRLGGETQTFLDSLNDTIEEKPMWKRRIVLIRYGHEKEITDWLSARCDVRVIWGGDKAVAQIQESPVQEGAAQLVFPNRRSMAVISSGAVITEENIEDVARYFYNDTYLTDQNACSSPGILCWVGNEAETELARVKFWKAVSDHLEGRYEIGADMAVLKLEQAMVMAANGLCVKAAVKDNRITRVQASAPEPCLWEYTMPCGFFIELSLKNVREIRPLLIPICQTISYYGIPGNEVNSGCGTFMTAPMGHTLDFSLNWDGHDLIREMSCKE